jgi:hypothetical protein
LLLFSSVLSSNIFFGEGAVSTDQEGSIQGFQMSREIAPAPLLPGEMNVQYHLLPSHGPTVGAVTLSV